MFSGFRISFLFFLFKVLFCWYLVGRGSGRWRVDLGRCCRGGRVEIGIYCD